MIRYSIIVLEEILCEDMVRELINKYIKSQTIYYYHLPDSIARYVSIRVNCIEYDYFHNFRKCRFCNVDVEDYRRRRWLPVDFFNDIGLGHCADSLSIQVFLHRTRGFLGLAIGVVSIFAQQGLSIQVQCFRGRLLCLETFIQLL